MSPRPQVEPTSNAVTESPLPPPQSGKGPQGPVPSPLDELMVTTLRPAQDHVNTILAGVAGLNGMGNPALQPLLSQIQEMANQVLPTLMMPLVGAAGGGLTPPPPGAPPTPMMGQPGPVGAPPMMGGM